MKTQSSSSIDDLSLLSFRPLNVDNPLCSVRVAVSGWEHGWRSHDNRHLSLAGTKKSLIWTCNFYDGGICKILRYFKPHWCYRGTRRSLFSESHVQLMAGKTPVAPLRGMLGLRRKVNPEQNGPSRVFTKLRPLRIFSSSHWVVKVRKIFSLSSLLPN